MGTPTRAKEASKTQPQLSAYERINELSPTALVNMLLRYCTTLDCENLKRDEPQQLGIQKKKIVALVINARFAYLEQHHPDNPMKDMERLTKNLRVRPHADKHQNSRQA